MAGILLEPSQWPSSTLAFCDPCGSLPLRAVTKQLQELFHGRAITPNVCGVCKMSVQHFQQNISISFDDATQCSSNHQPIRIRKQVALSDVFDGHVGVHVSENNSAIEGSSDERKLFDFQDCKVKAGKNDVGSDIQLFDDCSFTAEEKPVINNQADSYEVKPEVDENKPNNITSQAGSQGIHVEDFNYNDCIVGDSNSESSPVKIKEENIEVEDSDNERFSSEEERIDPELSEQVGKTQKCRSSTKETPTMESILEGVDPDLIRELTIPSSYPEKPLECKLCNVKNAYRCQFFRVLLTHVEHIHGVEHVKKPYKCSVCCNTFVNRPMWLRHSTLRCTPCSESDMLKITQWLDSRVIAMMGEALRVQAPFRCKHCTVNTDFKTPLKFVIHQKDNHAEQYDGEDLDFLIKNGCYKCPTCHEQFAILVYLQTHFLVHTGELPYTCDQKGCNKAYRSKNLLQSHYQSHDRQFLCNTCGARCSSNQELKMHIRNVHLKIRPFQCPHCDSAWSTEHLMKTHVLRMHLKLRPFICETCGKSFAVKSELKLHKRTHSEEKKFKCDECDYVTGRSGHLKIHKRQHSGETPYRCDECDKGFKQRTPYTRHMRKHHNDPEAWARAGTLGGSKPKSSKTAGAQGRQVTGKNESQIISAIQEEDTLPESNLSNLLFGKC